MDKVTSKDFRLASCQATLFTPGGEASSARLVKEFLPHWAELFDGDPTILPAAAWVPSDVPRVILVSKSRIWRCQIASARINVFWNKLKTDNLEPTISQIFEEATTVLSQYKEIMEVRVGRIAAVLKRFARHSTPGVYLAKRFCKESWLTGAMSRTENFELHTHKRFTLAEKFLVNSWVRNKTGQMFLEDVLYPVVSVEQDLNTRAEELEERDFSKDDIKGFFSAVPAEFDGILHLYYSTEASHAG